MGEAARSAMLARTTPGERFDMGLELADEALRVVIAQADVPDDLQGEERVRWLFNHLRRLGA